MVPKTRTRLDDAAPVSSFMGKVRRLKNSRGCGMETRAILLQIKSPADRRSPYLQFAWLFQKQVLLLQMKMLFY